MMDKREAIKTRAATNETTVTALIGADLVHDAQKIAECSSLWNVDRYDKAKILDIISVNRCKHRFCAHCQHIRAAKAAARVAATIAATVITRPDLHFYHMTLTKTSGSDLGNEIDRISRAYDKLYKAWADPRNKSKAFSIAGALRSLEITYSPAGWHAHIHALIASVDEIQCEQTITCYNGVHHSRAEIAVGELIAKATDDKAPHTECRIAAVTNPEKAAREITKYITKLSNLGKLPPDRLRELAQKTNGRRMVQGRGCLYHLASAECQNPDQHLQIERLIAARMAEVAQEDQMQLAELVSLYHDYEIIAIPKAAKDAAIQAAMRSLTPQYDFAGIMEALKAIHNELQSFHLDMKQPAGDRYSM